MKTTNETIAAEVEKYARLQESEAEIRAMFDAPKMHLTNEQLCSLHAICLSETEGLTRWLSSQVTIFAVVYCLQKEVLFRRRRYNRNLGAYCTQVLGRNKLPRYKNDLLFLYRHNKRFSERCDRCIEAVSEYLDSIRTNRGENTEQDNGNKTN